MPDLLLKGRTGFGEFLEGGEGIASNILTQRLARLEAHGLLERHRMSPMRGASPIA